MTPLDLEALRKEMYEKSPYYISKPCIIPGCDLCAAQGHWVGGVDAVIDFLKEKENGTRV